MHLRAAALAFLVACGSAKDSDSTRSRPAPGATSGTSTGTLPDTTTVVFTVDWTDDGETPTDTSGDGLPDVGCGDSVTVTVDDPFGMTVWQLGMAETGADPGWTGEDCLSGYGNFAYCHGFSGASLTLDQVTDCLASSVVEGSSTLLDAEKDPFLTYYFADIADCWVFGDDVTYYEAVGCFAL